MTEGMMNREPKPNIEPEKMKECAIRCRGQMFTGRTHFEAAMKLEKAFPDYQLAEVEEGFITNKGRYMERFDYETEFGNTIEEE